MPTRTPSLVSDTPVSRAQRNAEYNALMDAARIRAIAARHEAVHAFWQGVGEQADRGLRTFYRFHQRLARHAMQRQATGQHGPAEA